MTQIPADERIFGEGAESPATLRHGEARVTGWRVRLAWDRPLESRWVQVIGKGWISCVVGPAIVGNRGGVRSCSVGEIVEGSVPFRMDGRLEELDRELNRKNDDTDRKRDGTDKGQVKAEEAYRDGSGDCKRHQQKLRRSGHFVGAASS